MKFLITMNMPSRKGEMVHQVVCEYHSKNLSDFFVELLNNDFILVEEFYRKPENGGFYSVGMVILNTMHIGKIKAEVSREG
jgi:hypothetical protein